MVGTYVYLRQFSFCQTSTTVKLVDGKLNKAVAQVAVYFFKPRVIFCKRNIFIVPFKV